MSNFGCKPAQSPLNMFMQRYYYMLRAIGVFSRKATTGVHSEAIFRSVEEQATQNIWFEGAFQRFSPWG